MYEGIKFAFNRAIYTWIDLSVNGPIESKSHSIMQWNTNDKLGTLEEGGFTKSDFTIACGVRENFELVFLLQGNPPPSPTPHGTAPE